MGIYLLIENVILSGKAQAPFASFLFQGHVLDEKGNKMSKSVGNVIDAVKMAEENSADLLRLYFTLKSSPIEPLSFSAKEMRTRSYQILSTLYHMHLYFEQNSAYDAYDLAEHTVQWAKKEIYSSLQTFGYYQNFKISHSKYLICTLRVVFMKLQEGLTSLS